MPVPPDAETANDVSEALPRRVHLGLQFARTPSESANGLLISSVRPGSSAALMGVVAGDRLLELDRTAVSESRDVQSWLRDRRPGTEFDVALMRGAEPLRLTGKLLPLPLESYAGARVVLDQVRVGARRLRVLAVVPEAPSTHEVIYYLPAAHWASEEYPFAPEHPVRALLAWLASAGYATVRVERSGVGDSDGPHCTEVDFETELAAYRAGLRWIAEQPWAAPRPFLFGHSLGGMLAPLLALEAPTRGLIVFGTGVGRLQEILLGTARRRAALIGLEGDELAAFMAAVSEVVRRVVGDGLLPSELYAERPELAAFTSEWYAGDRVFGRVAAFYQQLERHDLGAAWQRVDVPVLVLHGTADWVASASDADRILELTNGRARRVELDGVDHFMQGRDAGGAPAFSTTVSEQVSAWLSEQRTQSSVFSSGQTQP